MKNYFFLTLILLLIFNADLSAQVDFISIKDFGAKPNDNISDQVAFNKAAEFINKKQGGVHLIIPEGRYLVGPSFTKSIQEKDIQTGVLYDVFMLINCSNVIIEGKGKVLIAFIDNLPFGKLISRPARKDSGVHIGSLFRLKNSKNITIKNIIADGNKEKFRLLKNWGAGSNPYEREHEGIFILNCQNVVVINSTFNNFGRDGGMILQDPENLPAINIHFAKCTFNNNGRNGFSWCGGDSVSFYQCKFLNNGRGKIKTNPAAGLDIEPERYALCKRGSFVKCEFGNNDGYAVTSGYPDASDVTFDSCNIEGNTNYALFCNSPKFSFKNTSIAGCSLLSFDADSEKDGMNFINCTFIDSQLKKKTYTPAYLTGITGRYAKFNNCTFTGTKVPVLYTEIKKKKNMTEKENSLFTNCFFNVYFKKSSTWGNYAFLVSHSNFVDCTFKSAGYANFKRILNDAEKNVHQQKSVFINN